MSKKEKPLIYPNLEELNKLRKEIEDKNYVSCEDFNKANASLHQYHHEVLLALKKEIYKDMEKEAKKLKVLSRIVYKETPAEPLCKQTGLETIKEGDLVYGWDEEGELPVVTYYVRYDERWDLPHVTKRGAHETGFKYVSKTNPLK